MFRPNELPVEIAQGTYRLIRPIGQGGMAAVYAAEVDLERFDYATAIAEREAPADLGNDRAGWVESRRRELAGSPPAALRNVAIDQRVPVPDDGKAAVKVLMQHRTERFESRFEAEWRALMAFDNRFLIRVYSGGFDPATSVYYYAMELLENQLPLKALCALEMPVKLDLVRQACRGLAALHRGGVVHRDVKPQNLICRRFDSGIDVKLGDLGIAKGEGSSLTQTGESFGSVCYMPPEQLDDASRVGPEADVYALGSTFYHLLASRPPYAGLGQRDQMKRLAEGTPPTAIETLTAVPAGIAALVRDMMRAEPEHRPSLADVLARLDSPDRVPSPVPRAAPRPPPAGSAPPPLPTAARPGPPPLPTAARPGPPPLPTAARPGPPPLPTAARSGPPPLPADARPTAARSGPPPVPTDARPTAARSGPPPLPTDARPVATRSGPPPLPPAALPPAARRPSASRPARAPGRWAATTWVPIGSGVIAVGIFLAIVYGRSDLPAPPPGVPTLTVGSAPPTEPVDIPELLARLETELRGDQDAAAYATLQELRARPGAASALESAESRWRHRVLTSAPAITERERASVLLRAEHLGAIGRLEAALQLLHTVRALDESTPESGREWPRYVAVLNAIGKLSRQLGKPDADDWVELAQIAGDRTRAPVVTRERTPGGDGNGSPGRQWWTGRDENLDAATRTQIAMAEAYFDLAMNARNTDDKPATLRNLHLAKAALESKPLGASARGSSILAATLVWTAYLEPGLRRSQRNAEYERAARLIFDIPEADRDGNVSGVVFSFRAHAAALGDESLHWYHEAIVQFERELDTNLPWEWYAQALTGVATALRAVGRASEAGAWEAAATASTSHVRRPRDLVIREGDPNPAAPTDLAGVDAAAPDADSPPAAWHAHVRLAIAAAKAQSAGGAHQQALDIYHRARQSFEQIDRTLRDWALGADVFEGIADEMVALGLSAETASAWRKRAKEARLLVLGR